MNTGLLTINGIGAGSTRARLSAPADLPPFKNDKQSHLTPAPNSAGNNALPQKTPYNTMARTVSGADNRPSQNLTRTGAEKTQDEIPPELDSKSASKCPAPDRCMAVQPGIVRLWLTQYSIPVEHVNGKTTQKVQPKAGYELAQLLTNLKTNKPSPAIAKAAVSAPNNSLQSACKQTPAAFEKTLLHISKAQIVADPGQTGGIKASKIQASGGITVNARHTTTAGGAKKTIPPALHTSSKANSIEQKQTVEVKAWFPAGEKPAHRAGNPTHYPLISQHHPLLQQHQPGPKKSPVLTRAATSSSTKSSPQGPDEGPQLSESFGSGSKGQGNNAPFNTASGKPVVIQLEISNARPGNRPGSESGKSSNSRIRRILSSNGPPPPPLQQSSAAAQPGKTASSASSPSASANISEQILESIYSSLSRQAENQQIIIRLNPPELGRVVVRFREHENQITGLLEVTKTQTRYEIEQALPEIMRNLQNAGIPLKRLDLILSDQAQQQACRDQSLQDGFFQQQGYPQSDHPNNPDTKAVEQWLTDQSSYFDAPQPQVLAADNSINMLA